MERYICFYLALIILIVGLIKPASAQEAILSYPFSDYETIDCNFTCYQDHGGIDYSGNGMPLYAPISGAVTSSKNDVTGQVCDAPNYGNYIKIRTGSYDVILGHMQYGTVDTHGGYVNAGDLVGYSGNTGYTKTLNSNGEYECGIGGGYHVHVELRVNGTPEDPEDYFIIDSDGSYHYPSETDGSSSTSIPTEAFAALDAKADELWGLGLIHDEAENMHWYAGASDPFVVETWVSGSWGSAGEVALTYDLEANSGESAFVLRTFWEEYQFYGPDLWGSPLGDEMDSATEEEYAPHDSFCNSLSNVTEACIELFCGSSRTYTSVQRFENVTLCWNQETEEVECDPTWFNPACYMSVGTTTVPLPTEDDLLVYGSTIYWVHNGSTRGIVSAEMFEACGFSWSDPYPVTEEVFSELPEGSVLDDPTDCGAVVDGTLVNQNGTVYEYWEADASWHGYPSDLVFNACQNDWSSIQEMSSSVFATITMGSVVGNSVDCGVLDPGDLVHWNGTVYRITEGSLKRGFTSAEVFNACGYDWDLITYLSLDEYPVVTTLQDGSDISNVSDCGYLTGEQITYLTPDLIWRETSTGTLGFWLMSGSTLSSWVTLGSSDLGWSVEGVGDFTGDGSVDILWRHLSSPYELYLWEMDGTTVASSVLVSGSTSPDWVIRGIADFTLDGEPDILWMNSSTGALGLWEMNGASYATSITIASSSSTAWDIRALGDLTGDGNTDILWRNASTGELSLWEMDGTSYVSSITVASSSSTDWDVLALGDFTSDLQADLLWRNPTTGDMGVWEMDGTSYVTSITMTSSSSGWTVVAVGEVDGN